MCIMCIMVVVIKLCYVNEFLVFIVQIKFLISSETTVLFNVYSVKLSLKNLKPFIACHFLEFTGKCDEIEK